MRSAFIQTLTRQAETDPDVMLVTGDVGFTVFEDFRDRFPAQFLNAGVAEQNMIGVASGLAMSGKKVFVYSITPFVTLRCLEHIRNDVCHHRLPVCIVGAGGGYSYGHMGPSHHALEDIAVLRSLAGMSVVCPGDPLEVAAAVSAFPAFGRPLYLRLGKAGEPNVHSAAPDFSLGRAIDVRPGRHLTIVATGTMLETTIQTAELLAAQGKDAAVVSMHTVKPLDEARIARAATDSPLLVTIEEHSRIGGLGSAVAETLSSLALPVRHLLCAAPDATAVLTGSQQYLREEAGLLPQQIAEKILSL